MGIKCKIGADASCKIETIINALIQMEAFSKFKTFEINRYMPADLVHNLNTTMSGKNGEKGIEMIKKVARIKKLILIPGP